VQSNGAYSGIEFHPQQHCSSMAYLKTIALDQSDMALHVIFSWQLVCGITSGTAT
jgi:hypothetical protein